MKQKRLLSLLMVLALVLSIAPGSFAIEKKQFDQEYLKSAKYLADTVTDPDVGSIGGEWAVFGLARSGYKIPASYYNDYYKKVEKYVVDLKGDLHDKKYTEYSRITVALSAIGKDPRNVGGYNLLEPLGNYDKTIWQGLNGPIWALIALDSGNYPMPKKREGVEGKQATRDMYIKRILDCEVKGGGWSLFGGTKAEQKKKDAEITGGLADSDYNEVADPDITGMALQALGKYRDRPEVKEKCDRAIAVMASRQDKDGNFDSWGTTNAESLTWVMMGLIAQGVKFDDPRFSKNGKSLLDALMAFRTPEGGFKHVMGGDIGNNQMTTEQGFYGMVAAKRFMEKTNPIFDMTDAVDLTAGAKEAPKKQNELVKVPAKGDAVTFADITNHKNKKAIEELASRGIIKGKGNGFDPNGNMTRAEFATIVVRGLGIPAEKDTNYLDVNSKDWFAGYVGAASKHGIVSGVGDMKFNPMGTITKEEAATMVTRAAKLCDMNTNYEMIATKNILSAFPDYVTVSKFAQGPMAFCYDKGILDNGDMQIQPKAVIKRCEIAQMLNNMLVSSKMM